MIKKEIEAMIQDIFKKQGVEKDIDFELNLEDSGFNSRSYIQLVVMLEEFYNISIDDKDLEFENFQTVNDICGMVEHYVEEK